MPRFGDRGAVGQRCRAVVGVAINIACAALLAVVPSHPDLLLGTAYICLKLRRPRRAYEAVARVSTSGVGQIVHPDRTAKQMTKIAAALCARAHRVEAACWKLKPPGRVGMLKVAKSLGIGTGTVQRIARELG